MIVALLELERSPTQRELNDCDSGCLGCRPVTIGEREEMDMGDMASRYLREVQKAVEQIQNEELEAIIEAGVKIGQTIADGKIFHVFGSGHSDLVATDCHLRAGGLACANRITDPTRGHAERVENYGKSLVERYDLQASEVIVIISNSGRNPAPIDIAIHARERGLTVIAITSLEHSRSVTSRHSSGKKLFDVADIVVDNHVRLGDACVEVRPGFPMTGAVSTVFGAILLNMILVQATCVCIELTGEAPLIVSQNLDDMDERNRELWLRYKQRLGPIEI